MVVKEKLLELLDVLELEVSDLTGKVQDIQDVRTLISDLKRMVQDEVWG